MKQVYHKIFNELRPSMHSFFGIGFFIFLAACIDALLPLPFKFLIDDILKYGDNEGATLPLESFFRHTTNPLFLALGFILLYFGIMFLSMILEYIYTIKLKNCVYSTVQRFSLRVFNSIETMSLEKYRSKDIGDYIYRIGSETSALGDVIEATFLQGFLSIFYVLSAFTIMLYLNATLALMSLLALPLFILIITNFGKKLGKIRKKAERSTSFLFSFLEETLTQLKNIQAYGQETREAMLFKRGENITIQDNLRVEKLNLLFHLILGIIVACVYGAVISVGIFQVQDHLISAGVLVLFMFYLDNLTHPLLSFLGMFTTFGEQSVILENVFVLLSKQTPTTYPPLTLSVTDISFHNVDLVVGNDVKILHRVSFVIPQKKITVIIGSNGSGKSMILSLLMGFLKSTNGTISIASHEINTFSIETLRSLMAFVPQEVALFDDTIEANIKFGSLSYDEKNIKRAARLADADHFISRLKGNYSFEVGNDGLRLSGGQQQKILLARAFARITASYILLDEPFSSLDINSMTRVISSLRTLARKKTIVIVSNSLEILNHADTVILLDNGRVKWHGTAKNLLKKTMLKKYISLI